MCVMRALAYEGVAHGGHVSDVTVEREEMRRSKQKPL